MIKIENHCVGCDKPCLHDACPYHRVEVAYCDHCKDNTPAKYKFDGWHYCEDCLHKKLNAEFGKLSISEKIDMLALDDEITEV